MNACTGSHYRVSENARTGTLRRQGLTCRVNSVNTAEMPIDDPTAIPDSTERVGEYMQEADRLWDDSRTEEAHTLYRSVFNSPLATPPESSLSGYRLALYLQTIGDIDVRSASWRTRPSLAPMIWRLRRVRRCRTRRSTRRSCRRPTKPANVTRRASSTPLIEVTGPPSMRWCSLIRTPPSTSASVVMRSTRRTVASPWCISAETTRRVRCRKTSSRTASTRTA